MPLLQFSGIGTFEFGDGCETFEAEVLMGDKLHINNVGKHYVIIQCHKHVL